MEKLLLKKENENKSLFYLLNKIWNKLFFCVILCCLWNMKYAFMFLPYIVLGRMKKSVFLDDRNWEFSSIAAEFI